MENNYLNGKKVLFISPKFFGYQDMIKNQLETLGAQVDFYDERPSNSAIAKGALRINRNLLNNYIEKYYSKLLKDIEGQKYDYLFVIKGEAITHTFLKEFAKLNPTSKKMLMLWDSIKNYEYVVEKAKYFDKCFSFDKEDCAQYGFEFRPLFYNSKYSDIAKLKKDVKYDLTFIGTVHSDRLKILEQIKNKLGNKYSYFYYLYIPSSMLYFVKKLFVEEFRKKSKEYFKFESLNNSQVLDYIAKSRIIVDIEHPGQTGLTMRTIEMIGAEKKIITTNQKIKEYDFYCEDNIYIIDRNKINIDESFISKEYKPIENQILQKYSLTGFLTQIFAD